MPVTGSVMRAGKGNASLGKGVVFVLVAGSFGLNVIQENAAGARGMRHHTVENLARWLVLIEPVFSRESRSRLRHCTLEPLRPTPFFSP